MGVHDNLQIYSVPKFDGHHQHAHPAVVQEQLLVIETFQRVGCSISALCSQPE